jgi:hypothetical protein
LTLLFGMLSIFFLSFPVSALQWLC